MRYLFKKKWFGPTEVRQVNAIFQTSGQRFREGQEYDLTPMQIEALPEGFAVPVGEADPVVQTPAEERQEHALSEMDEIRNIDRAVEDRLAQITAEHAKEK